MKNILIVFGKQKESSLDSAFKAGKHNVDKKELQKLLNQKLK